MNRPNSHAPTQLIQERRSHCFPRNIMFFLNLSLTVLLQHQKLPIFLSSTNCTVEEQWNSDLLNSSDLRHPLTCDAAYQPVLSARLRCVAVHSSIDAVLIQCNTHTSIHSSDLLNVTDKIYSTTAPINKLTTILILVNCPLWWCAKCTVHMHSWHESLRN